ncbi:MAG: UDP-N-acetylmuramoylalanine/D-glutamate ligase [Candidatus Uhrbacteria bacterium GW2011_GWE2_41_1153]|nr:MAG: UDP-N-acetylmuramoylalanine/D-glutamate ligase [Candidatus Uhrbacteria bacterium GW2011_GWE2_41_1153]KKS08374.1 MAG: UDP-N-acetylmuramoylalanine/D-glutamate ligase [Candidatus Uhrbacteria bacterium GW2011_GWF2_41_430]
MMFAKYTKYHHLFTSCNRSFKVHKERTHTLWCGECPKCAFTFLMLAPFLPKTELASTFGKNLLADESLIPLYRDLLGMGNLKPFDCVGTFEESRAAFSMASDKYRKDAVVKKLLPSVKDGKKLQAQVLRTVPAPTSPTQFRFLGIESVCILGFGKEGSVTQKYLKKFYPKIKVGVLDQTTDKKYLEHQANFDLAIKTPGIQKSKVTIPYVTATNLFFSSVKNLTIGVTGSKGKSTTASLIYEMLKADGRKVRLLGNIGNPMLASLLAKIDPAEIFVLELSSYMLDDIEYSPNIAVLLNLFPEHMDYHGGVDEYYKAKKQIFAFQTLGDIALRPEFKAKIPVSDKDIPLLGEHNRKNIKAAINVVKEIGVSDSSIIEAIKKFKSLPHRLEEVGEFKGIKFIDDAISTTPESTIEALRALKNVKTIFLGGEDRGYDFKELERELRSIGVENIVLFPDTGKRILSSTKGLKILKTKNMEIAVKFAYKVTPEGSTCLLSTASPSYSIWKNFEEKGDLFKKFVKKYSK